MPIMYKGRGSSRYEQWSESEADDQPKKCPPAPPKPETTTTTTASTTTTDKKKKKKKPPPQKHIERTWERFSLKTFNKALSVLPKNPVADSTPSERPNELVSAGYERAAEECKRKVNKIIQECRRINTRYRDPGWDIDWDLKWRKGHCLNYLGWNKFDLYDVWSSRNSVPKTVKRVHEIFDKPKFMQDLSGCDIKQGQLGDCWLIASFSGLAAVKGGIERTCVAYDTRIGIYGFVFCRDGEWIYSIIDDKLFLTSPCWDSPSQHRSLFKQIDRDDAEQEYIKTYQTGSKALFFGQNKDQDETWVPLLEKAYAKAHGDYASLIGGWVGEGFEDLTGGVTTELLTADILDLESFWTDEISRVNNEFLFGLSTGLLDGGYGNRDGIQEKHAFSIIEARTLKNGKRLVKLRNPWGKVRLGNWDGAWSDGSKEWTAEIQEELNHTPGSDSVFWMSYEDFIRKFQHIDRTRLFRDPDWRSCQRWVGMEVPWRPTYHEKFRFKLATDSPVVLVLSQLDERYFRGLIGQYNFRLHFRVHEQDKPDAEDFIVRSHGNYLMDRSVSIEIPNMAAGKYSVFIMVVAERWSKSTSVEDVIERECKKREDNEKLAKVGYAYDLAHSKAAPHLEEVEKMRKKLEQKTASDARMSERKKLWERKRLDKEIKQKQLDKNAAKHAKREVVRKAEWEKKRAAEREERAKRKAEEAAKKAAEEAAMKAAAEAKMKAEAEMLAKMEAEALAKKEAEEAAKKAAEEAAKTEGQQTDKKGGDVAESKESEGKEIESEENKTQESGSTDDTSPKDQSQDGQSKVEADEGKPKEADAETKAEAKTSDSTAASDTPAQTDEKTAQDGYFGARRGSAASSASSSGINTPQETPLETPKSAKSTSVANADNEEKIEVPPVKPNEIPGGPPPPPAEPSPKASPKPKNAVPAPPQPQEEEETAYSSGADSSDSPVSDWEEMFSEDDLTHISTVKPIAAATAKPKVEEDSEDEDAAQPWNAICVVGFRIYSKDEKLELRHVMEGGDLSEGGMGEKGEEDLDNAQVNAGGSRERKDEKKDDEGDDAEPSDKKEDSDKNESKEETDDAKKDDETKTDDTQGDTKKDDKSEDAEKKDDMKENDEKTEDVKQDNSKSDDSRTADADATADDSQTEPEKADPADKTDKKIDDSTANEKKDVEKKSDADVEKVQQEDAAKKSDKQTDSKAVVDVNTLSWG